MASTFNEIFDILDKWQFLLGQRAGRELWMNKPTNIQEEDLANFNRDLETARSFVNLLRVEVSNKHIDTTKHACNCDGCKYLSIVNTNNIYAECTKTGYVFEQFETDTRDHFCAFAERG